MSTKIYSVHGHFNDDGTDFDVLVAEGNEPPVGYQDDDFFYYLGSEPPLGDHGDFTLTEVHEVIEVPAA